MNFLTKALLSGLMVAAMHNACSQIALVVGASNETKTMTMDQASSMYLGKSNTFPGGATALLLDQPAGSALRTTFYEKLTGKNEAQVKAGWSRLVFSGKGTPPKELSNSADVKKMVSANPNTIGYIEKSALDSSVRALLIVE